MPIKLATVNRERTTAGLARSIFGIRNEPELQRRAEAALIKANPHLAGDSRLQAGSTVVVPDVPGLSTMNGVHRLPILPTSTHDSQGRRLSRLAKATERLVDIIAQDGEVQRAELKKRDFTAALARAHPDLREQMPQIAEAASSHAERLVLRARQLHDAVTRVQADHERRKTRIGPS